MFLFCVLWTVGICQYPTIMQKNPFPHTFVLTDSNPTLDVLVDYYFEGFNLSYNYVRPSFEPTQKFSFQNGFHVNAVEQISRSSVRIDGKRSEYAVLKDYKAIMLILEDNSTKLLNPLASVSANITCSDLMTAHDYDYLFLLCNDPTANNDSIVYRISISNGNIIESLYFNDGFIGTGTERRFKSGLRDDPKDPQVFAYYLFSLNRQTQEWLIQEFFYNRENPWSSSLNNQGKIL